MSELRFTRSTIQNSPSAARWVARKVRSSSKLPARSRSCIRAIWVRRCCRRFSIQFWDGPTGAARLKADGRFRIHLDSQEYTYRIDDGVTTSRRVFAAQLAVESVSPWIRSPPTSGVENHNDSHPHAHEFDSPGAGALLRGDTARDVRAAYDPRDSCRSPPPTPRCRNLRARWVSRGSPTSIEVTKRSRPNVNRAHFSGSLSGSRHAGCSRSDCAVSSPSSPCTRIAASFLVHAGGLSRKARGRRERGIVRPPSRVAFAQTRRHYEEVLGKARSWSHRTPT